MAPRPSKRQRVDAGPSALDPWFLSEAATGELGEWLRMRFLERPESTLDQLWDAATARSSGLAGPTLRYVATPQKLAKVLRLFPSVCVRVPRRGFSVDDLYVRATVLAAL